MAAWSADTNTLAARAKNLVSWAADTVAGWAADTVVKYSGQMAGPSKSHSGFTLSYIK